MNQKIKRLIKISPIIMFAVLIPIVTFAQAVPRPPGSTPGGGSAFESVCAAYGGFYGLLCRIHEILGKIIPVLIALGVVYFVWGVVAYVIGGDEEAKTKGKDKIVFGIIGLAIILGIWGLVKIVTNTFGIAENAPSQNQIRSLLPPRY
jgi:hypothetical protein